jgi:hypothetical protein
MNDPKIGFELKKIRLPLEQILPVRKLSNPETKITRYATILASIKELGLIEPLMVYPDRRGGAYLVMDGHLRLYALKELGEKEVDCLVATQDESYTYNARISRLAPIQEHAMIKRAVENGVPAERIAAALNMKVAEVKATLRLLDGIHEEAVDLLKTKTICPKAIRVLKRVSGVRQIEIAELMVSANNFTHGYAEALFIGTPKSQLLEAEKPKTRPGMTPEEIARLEREMEILERDFKAIEQTYGGNVLNLTLVRGYLKKLLENPKVVKFLSTKHSDLFAEFQAISAMEAI